jgi:hypothetical protein
METQQKSFRDCTLKFLEKTFSLEELDSLPALDAWLNASHESSDFETTHLIYLRQILDLNTN